MRTIIQTVPGVLLSLLTFQVQAVLLTFEEGKVRLS